MQTDLLCQHCGSARIEKGIRSNISNEASHYGLAYQGKFKLWFTEPFLFDICSDCGTVHRMYVKNTEHKWINEL